MYNRDDIREFYNSLSTEEKNDLCNALAEDFYFLDENIRNDILALLHDVEPEIYENICRINDFTT